MKPSPNNKKGLGLEKLNQRKNWTEIGDLEEQVHFEETSSCATVVSIHVITSADCSSFSVISYSCSEEHWWLKLECTDHSCFNPCHHYCSSSSVIRYSCSKEQWKWNALTKAVWIHVITIAPRPPASSLSVTGFWKLSRWKQWEGN